MMSMEKQKTQKNENSIMNILLIGSGGREHAIAWKLSQSPLTTHLYIAPGNAGTSDIGENLPILKFCPCFFE